MHGLDRQVVREAASVLLDIPTRSLADPFDYSIPVEMDGSIAVGCAVLVPFGSRKAVGYVVALHEPPPGLNLKPVERLLGSPMFDESAVKLAIWIAEEYVAPISEAIRLFLPPGSVPKAVKTLIDGIPTWVLQSPKVGDVTYREVDLCEEASYEPPRNASVQRAVLRALASGPVALSELRADLGEVSSAVRRLEEVGAVRVSERRRTRRPEIGKRDAPRHANLTDGQREAGEVIAHLGPGGVAVLDGVTGSGKTEVYLRAIETELDAGHSAIVLVPEISLTPQTVGRFRTRFGDDVAVLHSRLTAGERYDEWSRVLHGEAHVVVGARSALFAPVSSLGLIVIDEEHESSYKQGSSPRYHARDVAARIAMVRRAKLVLGSATPSMESLYECSSGGWKCVEMPERATGVSLPPVQVVDMAEEFRTGHRSMFSRELSDALSEVADRGEKAVLLLNRRGFASFLLCRECGYVPTCDSCSTSLTLHETSRHLACHHCSARRAVPAVCPECGSPYLRAFGAGTQRVESELMQMLPAMPCVRMDADTTGGKGGHERQLSAFEALESGVLVGTQMVAKGLDYPDVTLVGVLNADTTLHMPDFRAGERTFQLVSQVAGRAGRGPKGGRVIVQTYWPSHPAIQSAAIHDRTRIVAAENELRCELGYPPFGRLANILVMSKNDQAAEAHCKRLAEVLSPMLPASWTLLGPSRAPLSRVKRSYRWHLLLKAPRGAQLSTVVSAALQKAVSPRDVTVAPDIDPIDLL